MLMMMFLFAGCAEVSDGKPFQLVKIANYQREMKGQPETKKRKVKGPAFTAGPGYSVF